MISFNGAQAREKNELAERLRSRHWKCAEQQRRLQSMPRNCHSRGHPIGWLLIQELCYKGTWPVFTLNTAKWETNRRGIVPCLNIGFDHVFELNEGSLTPSWWRAVTSRCLWHTAKQQVSFYSLRLIPDFDFGSICIRCYLPRWGCNLLHIAFEDSFFSTQEIREQAHLRA